LQKEIIKLGNNHNKSLLEKRGVDIGFIKTCLYPLGIKDKFPFLSTQGNFIYALIATQSVLNFFRNNDYAKNLAWIRKQNILKQFSSSVIDCNFNHFTAVYVRENNS